MPTSPPSFSFRPRAARQAWAPSAPQQVKRIRGRAGQRLRHQVLSEEPLCRRCDEQGLVTASAIADHIVPLSQGGTNDRSNFQGLCVPCHDEKSKAESAAGRGGGSNL